ncbi:MAG: hypothetical protein R6U36_01040 [Candidatus Fermentibacteraceae bacterium]
MSFLAWIVMSFLTLPLCGLMQLLPLPLWKLALLPLLALGGCSGTVAGNGSGPSVSAWMQGADTAHVQVEGLEMRECMYVVARHGSGPRSYRLGDRDGLDLFLALHRDSPAVLRLESEEVFVTDSGRMDTVPTATSAMIAGESFERWLARETAAGASVDSLYEVYDQQYLEALGRR